MFVGGFSNRFTIKKSASCKTVNKNKEPQSNEYKQLYQSKHRNVQQLSICFKKDKLLHLQEELKNIKLNIVGLSEVRRKGGELI